MAGPNNNNNINDDLEFEEMMRERFDEEALDSNPLSSINDERLKEMNKKLPDWDLEPPFTYLK